MKTKKTIWIVGIMVALLVGGFFIFRYLMPNEQTPNNLIDNNATIAPSELSIPDVPDGLVVTLVDVDIEKDLSMEIGQMIMIGFRGLEATEGSYIDKVIKDIGIGGVILFDYDVPLKKAERNIKNKEQVKSLITNLQSFSDIPLFVAVDVEGGRVNRLKEEYGFLSIKSAKEMGQGEYSETEEEATKIGKQLKDLGFNMNMAPVVDVDINPDNPIIGMLDRAFSVDSMEVTWYAKAFIEGLRAEGVIAVVKHFPGHGSSKGDSHIGLVDVTDTYQPSELFPYHLLQAEGVMTAVMTAHIMNKNIDEKLPASLSSLFINDILRVQIKFGGVVISDDMQMGAITQEYGLEEATIKAILAGTDIVLFSNNSTDKYDEQLPYKVHDIIVKAVEDGRISPERILEAFLRIDNLKKQFNIVKVQE